MNVYVWGSLFGVTDCYHDDGGALAVAASVERARALISEAGVKVEWRVVVGWDRDKRSDIYSDDLQEPDKTWSTDATDEFVMIFPNAGCC